MPTTSPRPTAATHRRHHCLGAGPAAAVPAQKIAFALRPIAAPRPVAADLPGGWYIDVDSLLVSTPLSCGGDPWYFAGDTVSMAVLGFRTKLGGPGSTSVWVHSRFRPVCRRARAGTTCAVPDDIGSVHFGSVDRPSLDDARSCGGAEVEIVGTVQYLAIPSDVPTAELDTRLAAAASGLRTELVRRSERLSPVDLCSGPAIGHRAVDVLADLGDAMRFLPVVAPRITAIVGVDASLRDEVAEAVVGGRDRLRWTAAAAIGPRTLTFSTTISYRPTWPERTLSAEYLTNARVHHLPVRPQEVPRLAS